MKPALLVLAAGMGSRYGGLKQIDPVGPSGEVIMDYSMYDAIKAGFGKIVFVIRGAFEEAFRKNIGDKLKGLVEVEYVYQELDSCLGDFKLPTDREKPWGTGHAILVAKDVIKEPFAVINADDFYGFQAYKMMAEKLGQIGSGDSCEYAMVGYVLRNTLSEHGTVARGVCQYDDDMHMSKVTERVGIRKEGAGAAFVDDDGNEQLLTGDELVSMNFWGFGVDVFDHLSQQFAEYLAEHGNEPKGEFYIPFVVDNLIQNGTKKVEILKTEDSWFGVTYPDDKALVQESIRGLVTGDVYPENLWQKG
jgi:dTDP-glucose pyrophosphorylase